ncbi:hypothetical protein AVEN_275330-1 [Araneus ventricosus]|uniref:Uncharacterized protein n=1 Tax=Araneus ventricosus TaxID=182803 RepID=A0A4Y2J429_ARAVE|nr:hypothetical protein AVEN_275330-1 [Araneus ventricosus]
MAGQRYCKIPIVGDGNCLFWRYHSAFLDLKAFMQKCMRKLLRFHSEYSNMGVDLPPTNDSTYRLREESDHGLEIDYLLGLRPQYSSYCSGCHSEAPYAKASRV